MVAVALVAAATAKPVRIERAGTFGLDGVLEWPARAGDPEGVVVLIHGSGPHGMDGDLAAVTAGGVANPFLKDLAEALRAEGFAVLRYHKRSHQAALLGATDPGFFASPEFRAYAADPMGAFLDDAEAAVVVCERELPRARRYLLGHSQGTLLALQLARRHPGLDGVGLIGFSLMGTATLVFEQTAYRPLGLLRRLDRDHDGGLDGAELGVDDPLARALAAQLGVLDLDHDGRLSEAEFMGGNLSNWMLRPEMITAFDTARRAEASWPMVPAVLRDLTLPIAFFAGELDNQTPAYNAKAVQMAAPHQRPVRRRSFRYFAGLGHALDPRDSYDDLVYRRADPAALQAVARGMRALGE